MKYKFIGKKHENLKTGDIIEMEKLSDGFKDKFVAVVDEEPPCPNPTFEEYTAAGYAPEGYPPQGFEEVPSEGLTAFREQQAAAQLPENLAAIVPTEQVEVVAEEFKKPLEQLEEIV